MNSMYLYYYSHFVIIKIRLMRTSYFSYSTSTEAIAEVPCSIPIPDRQIAQYDSDLETEQELPGLDTVLSKDQIKKLKPKEKKRQEVINGRFKF